MVQLVPKKVFTVNFHLLRGLDDALDYFTFGQDERLLSEVVWLTPHDRVRVHDVHRVLVWV